MRSAFASICRMRSRVTSKSLPTSSSVWSELLADAEAHAQHLLLARRQRRQHLPRLLGQVHRDDRVGRRDRALVLDEVAEVRVLFLADGRVQRQRLCASFRTFRTLSAGMSIFSAISSGVGSRPSSCTSARLVRTSLFIVSIMWTGMRIVRAWSAMARVMRLADPPRRVRRELVAPLVVELVDGPHEADVAFLDEVQELQAAVRVLLRDRHDEAQVRLDQRRLGLIRDALAAQDLAHRLAQHALRQARPLPRPS